MSERAAHLLEQLERLIQQETEEQREQMESQCSLPLIRADYPNPYY